MKSDLDALMQEANIDALLVTGGAFNNPAMVYFTGLAHLTWADLVRPRGAEPMLFHHMMERDEAALSGLRRTEYTGFRFDLAVKAAGGDRVAAAAQQVIWMLAQAGVTGGRVMLCGIGDSGEVWELFSRVRHLAPEFTLVGPSEGNLLMQAMATKDAAEVEHIRRMGRVTTGVVGRVAQWLREAPRAGDVLLNAEGQTLTVGQVKTKIDLWLAELGAENPEGTIFSIGRDAGVPHSTGGSDDPLRTGQTIVFDIYPRESGGGYVYDFTRTWCVGDAPPEVTSLYQDVRTVYEQLRAAVRPGMHAAELQDLTNTLFEGMGHATLRSNPVSTDGYIHALGHGVGLHIHERPVFGDAARPEDRLNPGTVFTLEPGLYYPERGMGVRLEDTYWISPEGKVEVLADYPLDLLI